MMYSHNQMYLAGVVGAVLHEAIERHDRSSVDDESLARLVREHFLDRWYRFTEFGVTARPDLSKLTVVVRTPDAKEMELYSDDEAILRRAATVVVAGTPLEKYIKDRH